MARFYCFKKGKKLHHCQTYYWFKDLPQASKWKPAIQQCHCVCLIWKLKLTEESPAPLLCPLAIFLVGLSLINLRQLQQIFSNIQPYLRPSRASFLSTLFALFSIRLAAVCVALLSDLNFFMLNLFMPPPSPAAQNVFQRPRMNTIWSIYSCGINFNTFHLQLHHPYIKAPEIPQNPLRTRDVIIIFVFAEQSCFVFTLQLMTERPRPLALLKRSEKANALNYQWGNLKNDGKKKKYFLDLVLVTQELFQRTTLADHWPIETVDNQSPCGK